MRIHMPSLCVGVISAVILGSLMAADHAASYSGRFAIEAVPNHVFVLDRETGRVWEKYVPDTSGSSDPDFAQPKRK